MIKNRKKKGTDAERELVHYFWRNEWAAARVAGSGSMRYPSPDLIVGRNGILYVIECKTTEGERQYFEQKEIEELKEFAKIMSGIALIAVKFKKQPWKFYPLTRLTKTSKKYVIKYTEEGMKQEHLLKTSKPL